jgi:NAD(P)-dependent dehydrogenase (short-subunit alcohol dehydrogenase family)
MGIERFRYDGKRCVVTGAASGMGEATAQALVELGAEVYGLDVNPVKVDGIAKSILIDLKDKSTIEGSLEEVGGRIDGLFSVAGLPGAPFSNIDTITVNFIGARHLIETAVNRSMMPAGSAIGCVTSFAGNGWEMQWARIQPLVAELDFDASVKWCNENDFGGYGPSKGAMNAYVGWRNVDMLSKGIRINAIGPGVTDTGMSAAFVAQMGETFFENFPKPIGRNSRADEQAYPLVFACSDAASYLSGTVIYTDGGLGSGMVTGRLAIGG